MNQPHGSVNLTNGIEVRVTPEFLPDESDSKASRWVFGYHIVVSNKGRRTVQLLSRHWVILDADGERRDVRGSGVVGRRPILGPGESFEYRSGCPLGTPWGTMEGTYTFRTVSDADLEAIDETLDEDEGMQPEPEVGDISGKGRFSVTVGRFYLVAPTEKTPK